MIMNVIERKTRGQALVAVNPHAIQQKVWRG
jgi:hypothetical protein